MLNLSLPGRVFLCTLPTDMRKSFDSLCGLVVQFLGRDPLSGDLFVFRSKRGDRLKLLFWDEDGLVIYYKRLEEGSFVLPQADSQHARAGEHGLVLKPAELAMLLAGIDLSSAKRHKRYQRPQPPPANTPSPSASSSQ
jgi:transposase